VYIYQNKCFHMGNYKLLLSRGVSRGSTRVLCKPSKDVDAKGNSTRNLVYTKSMFVLAYNLARLYNLDYII
jgi:hypothetical protein